MKKQYTLKVLKVLVSIIIFTSCGQQRNTSNNNNEDEFSFVFMTDIHLQPELRAPEGFKQAIDSVNRLNPDFVITGGDLIMDALGQRYGRADSLFKLYRKLQNNLNMPVYNTIGNHEIFGIYDKSGVDQNHPEYGEKMYENRLGKRYYSFDHKGWHFLILDGIEDTGKNHYIGMIDSIQMEWIRTDLKKVDEQTPVVISVHIPFITVATQLEQGALVANSTGTVVNNSKEVLELFKEHNLKLVLQGHLHYVEDLYAGGTHFITGGAVSSKWWGGKYRGMEEGFVIVHVQKNNFTWEYFDYGWEAEEVENW